MKMKLAILVALGLVAAACSSGADAADEPATTSTTVEAASTTETTTTTEQPASSGLVVTVAESSLGEILVDGEGNTLYMFVPDEQGESVCYDQCEAAWPPLTGEFEAGDGVDASLFGTAPRTDGSVQVTYDGWPLYYFANDAAPGDVNGQGVNEVWYVLAPNGDVIR